MMASRNSQATGPKPSFASVAAMAATPPKAQPSASQDDKGTRAGKPLPSDHSGVASLESTSSSQIDRELQASIARLDIKSSSPVGTVPDHEINGITRVGLRLDEERTHLSSSSTKPASLDGKSVASGTTFAMDEKESLRPDDSASVKAAEEEDSYSGPASGAPSSRVGSEAGGRAFRDQFSEISERMGPGVNRAIPLSRRVIPGIAEEGPIVPMIPAVSIPTTLPGQERLLANGGPFVFQYLEPDDKLIEALESPKDRSFLLHLEQQVITFIKDSQDQLLDLPPCNSFYRLLTHRLGDYYALTHFVDNSVAFVRLWRTPFCRVRTPLSTYVKPSSNTDTPVSTQPSMKIMRRVGLGIEGGQTSGSGPNTTTSSIAASKAGSETGDESQRGTGMISPSDSTNAKDKSTMTREEREAKYKETRERIFKDFSEDAETTEAATGSQTPNEISRTSSTTGQKKKSKKHKHNDDGFEARSQFNAYYANVQYPVTTYDQGANPMACFNPYGTNGTSQTVYPGMPQMFTQPYPSSQPLQPYPVSMQQPTMTTSSYMQPNGIQNVAMYGQQMPVQQIPVQQLPVQQMPLQQMPVQQMPMQQMPMQQMSMQQMSMQQIPGQYYQPMQQSNQMVAQSSTMSSPALSNVAQLSRPQSQMSDQQHWSHTTYINNYSVVGTSPQHGYQQQNQVQMQANSSMGGTPTMPYPYGQLPYQPNIPGGRSQHPVPGSYSRPTFNPQTRAFVPGNGFVPQQTPGYSTHLQAQTARPNFQMANGASFTPPQNIHIQVPQVQPMQQQTQYMQPPSNIAIHNGRKTSGQTPRSQSPGQNSLSKWGTAGLPPKPPPPESSQPNIATMQNMTTGQSMPTFQNGTYS